MNKKKQILVSKFDNVKSNRSYVVVDILQWLLSNHLQDAVENIRSTLDKDVRREMKCRLPAITPSGIFHERNNKNLIEPSSLICIDIDGKDNPSISDMEELKRRLSKLSYIMYCGLSASGKGLFCIIPYSDFNNHKLYFNALEQEFEEMGIVIDSSCSDIARLRIASYDECPYVNPDAETYVHTLEKSNVLHSRSNQKKTINNLVQSANVEMAKALSTEEALLQPSNLDFASAVPLTKTQEVKRLLNLVVEKKIDITYMYKDWIDICHIIKNLFGEEGRELCHQVCGFYPRYDYDETERLYSSIVSGEYHYNTDRLFEIAAKYGICK